MRLKDYDATLSLRLGIQSKQLFLSIKSKVLDLAKRCPSDVPELDSLFVLSDLPKALEWIRNK